MVREFVDANVLVYAFDTSAGARHETAARLLERLWTSEMGHLSVQVLQEFFVTVTRKVARPLPVSDAEDRVRELAAWRVFAPTADDVLAAIAVARKAKLSFWDAMSAGPRISTTARCGAAFASATRSRPNDRLRHFAGRRRFSFESRARNTSPMPPAPSSVTIS